MILIISDCEGNGCKWELSVKEGEHCFPGKSHLGECTQEQNCELGTAKTVFIMFSTSISVKKT